jgi:DNA-binding beta-propeller fold protein YncE
MKHSQHWHVLTLLVFANIANAQTPASYRSHYDDSTLIQQGPATIMPYNRLIHSAGEVVRFGDPKQENHALDFAILPDSQHIVVEDRYGIQVLDIHTHQFIAGWNFREDPATRSLMSTYSGIKALKYQGKTYITWSAATTELSAILFAEWTEGAIKNVTRLPLEPAKPAQTAIPNDIAIQIEDNIPYLYVVLNGNNQLIKLRFPDRKIIYTTPTGVAPYGLRIVNNRVYITNWAGPQVTDTTQEIAGTPWGSAYTNPVTGATARGTLSIIDAHTGNSIGEVPLGLHPNAIINSPDSSYLYICNSNSDNVSIFSIKEGVVTDSIPVGLFAGNITYYGSSPNALQLDPSGETLYVANGFDNALAVIKIKGKPKLLGYIPTEAYPGGITMLNNQLFVANIEARGSSVLGANNAYTIHQEMASVSIIPIPSKKKLKTLTKQVRGQSLLFRLTITNRSPRRHATPKPVPERIGEPSVFKHVVYIIKENKTYDQVLGDLPHGAGQPNLCVFGDSVTPNEHQLAKTFPLLDNYYAAGKCSAEGHQWADAAMVSDYVEKNVRAWFRSYPHRQEDALVYNRPGFVWNNALDHGKKVKVYGEACTTQYDHTLKWADIYKRYTDKEDQGFRNKTTIGRLRPIISPDYPDCDNLVFTDQLRADVFLKDWHQAEQAQGDILPDFMVLSLPDDHTAGTSPNFPIPKAMVADNDLAVGRIIDAITHSRFWDSTVVFITEDDSQSGWDHISPYRTVGFVISPYSVMNKAVHTNYNQTGMVRTIEQILGIPPMNVIDATALPLFDCFNTTPAPTVFNHLPNRVPLDLLNKPLADLKGKAATLARASANQAFKDVDGGDDDLMNRILWFDAKGDEPYPTIKAVTSKSIPTPQ